MGYSPSISHTILQKFKTILNLIGGIQPKYRSYNIIKIQNTSQSNWWDTAQVSVIQYYKNSKQFCLIGGIWPKYRPHITNKSQSNYITWLSLSTLSPFIFLSHPHKHTLLFLFVCSQSLIHLSAI